jgi:hypothetical protein
LDRRLGSLDRLLDTGDDERLLFLFGGLLLFIFETFLSSFGDGLLVVVLLERALLLPTLDSERAG